MDQTDVVVTFGTKEPARDTIKEVLENLTQIHFIRNSPQQNNAFQKTRREILQHADILMSWNLKREITNKEYSDLENLKLIQLISAGADHFIPASLPEKIKIASNVGAYSEPMAEHVLAMVFALAKRLPQEHEKMKQGQFNQFTMNKMLYGKTCGIIGYGGIGRATGSLMSAVGMKIYAINQSGKTSEPVDFIGTLRDLQYVLGSSDVVVISLPLTRMTKSLIGKQELEWMKEDMILVNVARGEILDEEAFYSHLKSHPSFMAGIDAWWVEPIRHGEFRTNFPFFDLPNLLGSPHNSAQVPGWQNIAIKRAAENVKNFILGNPITGIVNRELYN